MFSLRLLLLLAIPSVVFAQIPEAKPPDAGSGANAANTVLEIAGPNPCESSGGVDVLTDTMGVDFGPYLARLTKTVRTNWLQIIPPTAFPPMLKQGRVAIDFFVLNDGKVKGMVIHVSSGDVALDRAAWGSITSSNPFAKLPAEFVGPLLGLRFFFYYNPSASIVVSPCVDVRVPAGSTQGFTASEKSVIDESVTWSVYGPGCVKAACGTISDHGLYTAPANIPAPPTVVVQATSENVGIILGKTKLTVVAGNPSH